MADTSRLYTLEQVVQAAIVQGDHNENKATRFMQLAIKGWRKLRRNTVKEGTKYLKVTPDAINTITFPQDMEEFIGLYVPVDGKMYFLTERDNMVITHTEAESGALSLDPNYGEGTLLKTSQYPSFRATGGYNLQGYFNIDWENDRIVVNSVSRSELVLVYITSGTDLQNNTWIPTRAVDTLVWYILWQDVVVNPNVSDSLVYRYKNEYLEERKQLKINDLFSVQEFRDVWNESNNLLGR